MKMLKENALVILLLVLVLVVPTSCTVYKYKDCKKVGHTTLYCVFLNNGSR